MANYFISCISSDLVEAQWIAQELHALGHAAHIHEWEIGGGEVVAGWMPDRHGAVDHVVCVVSEEYVRKRLSSWEHNCALWEAVTDRPGFVLFVVVKQCEMPVRLARLKCCELHPLTEDKWTRKRLRAYVANPAPPPGYISLRPPVAAESNIVTRVPTHFVGRDGELAAIGNILARCEGRAERVQAAALCGMRGVGKSVLAAAYAHIQRYRYRATWWIKAKSPSTMRADLAGLGARFGWLSRDEQQAANIVLDRLQHKGEDVLLVYDGAEDLPSLLPFLPKCGAAHVLITSNDKTWLELVEPFEISPWPVDVGAAFLVARARHPNDRIAALALSKALAGLPLAHEQAAAYCERLDISFDEYRQRFEAAAVTVIYNDDDAIEEDPDRRTIERTFSLAIEEATKLHPAAGPLIVHAALLAPEHIPRYLFSEGQETLGEPLASMLTGDGLVKAISALRSFALIELETVPDERDHTVTTEAIRLHRIVRDVAALQCSPSDRSERIQALLALLIALYPDPLADRRTTLPRARRLDGFAMDLVHAKGAPLSGTEEAFSKLLDRLAIYRHGALADYKAARTLYERALAIRKKTFGPTDATIAISLDNLGELLESEDDFSGDYACVAARVLYQRALSIREKALGPYDLSVAISLDKLGGLLETEDFEATRVLYQRALAIREKALGADHADNAISADNLAFLHRRYGYPAAARPFYERSLAIREKALGLGHPFTYASLEYLVRLLESQNDLLAIRRLYERALEISEKTLGPSHSIATMYRDRVARMLESQGDLAAARLLYERTLAISETVLGPDHPDTANCLNNMAGLIGKQDGRAAARRLYERALTINEKALGFYAFATKMVARNLVNSL